jgi:diacylglycerol kinase family enzyme
MDDEDAALRLAATGTRTHRVDLAYAGDAPFLNAASSGLSVLATRRAEPLKQPLGPLAYAAGALIAGARAKPSRVRVSVDGAPLFSGDSWQVIVAGTGAFGGGSQLDDAQPGALDVAVVCGGPRRQLVRRAWGMRTGGLTDQPGVVSASGETVTVEGPGTFNVDGEVRDVPQGRFTLGPRVAVVVA